MKNLITILSTLIRMAFVSAILSLIFSSIQRLIGLIIGKDNGFLIPFIGGSIAIFALYFFASLIKTIITLYRYKKDPIFKEANLRVGLDWETYQRIKRDSKKEKKL